MPDRVQDQPAFLGWIRDKLAWRSVASGATLEDCWFALLRVPAVGNHAERAVLAVGRSPHRQQQRDPQGSGKLPEAVKATHIEPESHP
jgi:hypothetical protein